MKPVVSIICLTYKHERYISKAIEGFLMQETNFEVEIIICDDCSPDRTSDIVTEYSLHHPKGNKIKYFKHQKNLGPVDNGLFALKKAVSKYIALCEGDDYWIDRNKLQKQVDFLEKNPDYSICFHPIFVQIKNSKPKLSTFYKYGNEETYYLEDLAKGNIINTPSVIFRNGLITLPQWTHESIIGDYVLHMLNAQYGKIKYFPEPMAVYRLHDSNTWGGKTNKFQCQNMLIVLHNLINYFQNSPQVVLNLKHQTASLKSQIAEIVLNEGNTEEYLKNIKEAFSISESFMDEWLINANTKHKILAQSMEYKIGWTLKNPRFLLKKLGFKKA